MALEFTEQFKLLRAISCSSLCRRIVTASLCSMDDTGEVGLENISSGTRIYIHTPRRKHVDAYQEVVPENQNSDSEDVIAPPTYKCQERQYTSCLDGGESYDEPDLGERVEIRNAMKASFQRGVFIFSDGAILLGQCTTCCSSADSKAAASTLTVKKWFSQKSAVEC